MPESLPERCDVLIIGAGMAGACLARQLSLELPELDVVLLDRKETFDWWVGESTIEVFDDYAIRNLRLGPYLATHHITKHGLRFWFDSAEKDLPLVELSEQGRSRYTALNRGVQLDRARFDRDLCEINRRNGVRVHLGVSVEKDGIHLDAGTGHRIRTNRGEIRCTWLVDAGGRSSPLVRQLDLLDPASESRNVGSVWGRYSGTRSIDDVGDAAWRGRVANTLRWASTNHFMYDGYWIWLIPVTDRLVSFGVTFDRNLKDITIRNGEELTRFLRSHRALDEILGPEARAKDFLGLKQITRGSRQFFSTDRWCLTGMAGMFVDPLFSSNAGLLALNNRLIQSAIEADRAGEAERLALRVKHFNIALRNIYARQCRQFSQYHSFGSFDAFVNWQTLRYHTILNHDVPNQHADYQPILETVDGHGDDCGCAVGRMSPSQSLGAAGDRLTAEFVTFVDSRGTYYARNRGHFHEKTERPATRQKTVDLDFGEAVRREDLLNWEAFVRYYVRRMCEMDRTAFDEAAFVDRFKPDWNSGQTLSELFEAMRTAAPKETPGPVWDLKGPVENGDPHEAWWSRFTGPRGENVR